VACETYVFTFFYFFQNPINEFLRFLSCCTRFI